MRDAQGNSKAGCKQASGKALKVPSCWAGSLSGVRADDGREAAEHLQSCSEAQNYSITLIDGIARTPTTTRRGGIPPQRVLRALGPVPGEGRARVGFPPHAPDSGVTARRQECPRKD